jgi:hypothetical protein
VRQIRLDIILPLLTQMTGSEPRICYRTSESSSVLLPVSAATLTGTILRSHRLERGVLSETIKPDGHRNGTTQTIILVFRCVRALVALLLCGLSYYTVTAEATESGQWALTAATVSEVSTLRSYPFKQLRPMQPLSSSQIHSSRPPPQRLPCMPHLC